MGFCFVSLFPPFLSSFLFFSFLFFVVVFFFGGGRTASVFLGGHGPRWPPPPPGSAVGTTARTLHAYQVPVASCGHHARPLQV